MPEPQKTWTEECKIAGQDLLLELKNIVREGNVTHILIKNEAGAKVLEIPLSVGLFGAVLLPVWAAIGAIAAVANRYTVEITRTEPPAAEPPTTEPPK